MPRTNGFLHASGSDRHLVKNAAKESSLVFTGIGNQGLGFRNSSFLFCFHNVSTHQKHLKICGECLLALMLVSVSPFFTKQAHFKRASHHPCPLLQAVVRLLRMSRGDTDASAYADDGHDLHL